MAWLIVCPHHKTGIFGLLFLFFVLFHQPTLHGFNENGFFSKKKLIIKGLKQVNFYKQFYFNLEFNLFYQIFFFFFLCAQCTLIPFYLTAVFIIDLVEIVGCCLLIFLFFFI
jgi:hypothetical protein